MDSITNGILTAKLLEVCDCDTNSLVYNFSTTLHKELEIYANSLHNLPRIIDASIDLFSSKKINISKSPIYANLKSDQNESLKLFNKVCEIVDFKSQKKVGQDKIGASLSALSRIYFDSFTKPIQFFLPHSSGCSGKWDFWDSLDFFAFKEKLNDKEFNFNFRQKILQSKVWNPKFDLRSFPLIVQRRLLKEKSLEEKLKPEAMIKAMIIRLGEMGRPSINYQIIDFSIREFFTYLGVDKYQRVDREIEFLTRLDKEIINVFKGLSLN